MTTVAEIKVLLADWLTSNSIKHEFCRSINPPGMVVYILNQKINILITDSAIEDNVPNAVLSSLVDLITKGGNNNCSIVLMSDLNWVIK